MKTKLRLKQVAKSYGAVKALRPISLEVPEGQFLTLLGPSGSGKSTLLQILAGLTSCDEGEVWIDGKLSTDTPPHDREIGLIFQNYALFPHLTVAQNIAFPLEMRRVPRGEIRKRVDRILEVVQLPQVGDRLPRELSGGQQQRVAIARALAMEPELMLFDEATSALDNESEKAVKGSMERLMDNRTMLVIAHRLSTVRKAQRIVVLTDNGVHEEGTHEELIASGGIYSNLYNMQLEI